MNHESSPNQEELISKKLLVADDDESIRRILSILLSKYGKITCVDSGNSAIELLKRESFDLILADYDMPEGNGLDLLQHLKKSKNKTPTIMITAFSSKDVILQSIENRVFSFIEKPFTQEILDRLVPEALTQSEEQKNIENMAQFGNIVGEIVHEISSPLTVLDFQIREITGDTPPLDVDRMIRSVEKIKKIITHTKDSIRDIHTENHESLNLSECMSEASQEFSIRAQKKQVTVELKGNFDIPIFGEKIKICQILVNLVNNSIDAVSGHPQNWVRIETLSDSDFLQILITDSGKGIPIQFQEKLFQPLFSTKGKEGNGLGLSIVRKIAKELNGEVHLNPNCPNTQFVIRLPLGLNPRSSL